MHPLTLLSILILKYYIEAIPDCARIGRTIIGTDHRIMFVYLSSCIYPWMIRWYLDYLLRPVARCGQIDLIDQPSVRLLHYSVEIVYEKYTLFR